MSKRRDELEARRDAIAFLGKDLARRAKRKCELCEEADDLRPYDTLPDQEPELDTLILMCARCRSLADGGDADPRTLRFLETAVWNEHQHVAAFARTLLTRVDAQWARDTLEML